MTAKGAVAAGHPETARAAADILRDGGNAFDAALAALAMACVAEPALTSLGGGGFLLARPAAGRLEGAEILYDCFVQTPRRRQPEAEIDFVPVRCDFGVAQQEFHIGMGAIATPGLVRGMTEVHRDLCSMSLRDIVAPAVARAREGVAVNALQAYVLGVVGPILLARPEGRAVYGSRAVTGGTLREGELLVQPELAEVLEILAIEGADLFHRGEIAQAMVEACVAHGGHLRRDDLASYQVERRQPLALTYRGAHLLTNPPPSTGGILIAFALELLAAADAGWPGGFGSLQHLSRLAAVMDVTNEARVESRLHETDTDRAREVLLHPGLLETYRHRVAGHPLSRRGTTHISVVDAAGNVAAVTSSNGEGCGFMVPGTGIMLNNMLGEEDINPHGFHRWPTDTRMASMMAPTLALLPDGRRFALGSGGSNRIRTAILQVLVNLLDLGMRLDEAVEAPRIHLEAGLLSVEPDFQERVIASLTTGVPDVKLWDRRNLFFGGVHAVAFEPRAGHFQGAGDSRRGGIALTV